MAGLAGIIDGESSTDEKDRLLSRMLQSMKAETWYNSSGQALDSIALGRVSLGLFNTESQPIFDQAHNLCAMIDGEIYNPLYQPLKQRLLKRGYPLKTDNDAELLMYLYKEHGLDFVQGINGSFNLVIWDNREQKLIIANDRYGSRPFYYHRDSNRARFTFASEIKALLEDRHLKREINLEAITEFFTFRHILGDKTPFVNINYLPAATTLVYQKGQITIRTYWTPPLIQQAIDRPVQDYVEESVYLLRQAVDRCMSRSHTVGFLLSGGVDSRLLVGLVDSRHLPFHTFTRGTPGCDDARLAQMIADQIGSIHHFMEIPPDYLIHRAQRGVWLTDGLMTSVDFYALSTVEHLRPHVDAVCYGLVSAGIEGLGLSQDLYGLDDTHLADTIYARRASYIPDRMQSSLFAERFYQKVKGLAHRNLYHILTDIPLDRSELKAQYYFLRHYSPRAGMHGPVITRSQVETRFPMADADFMDFIYTVPAELRIGRKLQVKVLTQACPELAEIPWQFSGLQAASSTPRRTRFQRALYRLHRELHQRSFGLIPLPQGREQANYPVWFRTVLRPWLEDTLLSERTLSRGYYNREGIRQLIEQHMSKRYDRTIQFGLLLTFELWNRIFVDGDRP